MIGFDPLTHGDREPESSFTALNDVAEQFLDAIMSEGISMEKLKGERMLLLKQAEEAFDDQGLLKRATSIDP